jgi:hypothetical protein
MRRTLSFLFVSLIKASSVEQLLLEDRVDRAPVNDVRREDNTSGHQAAIDAARSHLKHLINIQVEQAVLT